MITKDEIVKILEDNKDGYFYTESDERGIVFMEDNLEIIAQEILDKIENKVQILQEDDGEV